MSIEWPIHALHRIILVAVFLTGTTTGVAVAGSQIISAHGAALATPGTLTAIDGAGFDQRGEPVALVGDSERGIDAAWATASTVTSTRTAGQPGFGVAIAVFAIAVAAIIAWLRS
ncbi:MAG: hypothetical protein ABEH65_05390 [Halobacteriales archaeon]